VSPDENLQKIFRPKVIQLNPQLIVMKGNNTTGDLVITAVEEVREKSFYNLALDMQRTFNLAEAPQGWYGGSSIEDVAVYTKIKQLAT
jgi:hypothetical protein